MNLMKFHKCENTDGLELYVQVRLSTSIRILPLWLTSSRKWVLKQQLSWSSNILNCSLKRKRENKSLSGLELKRFGIMLSFLNAKDRQPSSSNPVSKNPLRALFSFCISWVDELNLILWFLI